MKKIKVNLLSIFSSFIIISIVFVGWSFIAPQVAQATCYKCQWYRWQCAPNAGCGELCNFALTSDTCGSQRDACNGASSPDHYAVNVQVPACDNDCNVECFNRQGAASPCGLGSQTPALSTACGDCINNVPGRPANWIVDFYNSTGGNNTHAQCTTGQMVSHMCNGGISADAKTGCLADKNSATCASICGGGAGTTPPTASISGPANGTTTSSLPYTANAAGTNLRQVLIYYAKTTDTLTSKDSWHLVGSGNTNCAGANTCATSGSFTPPTSGSYYVVVNAQVNNGSPFCSGNPATPTLSCGNNDTITLTVGGSNTSTPTPTPSIDPNYRTYQYRFSIDTSINNATWTSYSAAVGNILTVPNNTLTLGTHIVYVQFQKNDGTISDVDSRQITYAITTSTPTPTPTVSTYTADYRCSDVSFDPADTGSSAPQWYSYVNQDGSGQPVNIQYTFTHNIVSGGSLTLFCQFRDNKGIKSAVVSKSIIYAGGASRITSALCTYSPTGTGTQVTIKGINFGEHINQGSGNVAVEGKATTINSWSLDTSVDANSTSSATPTPANNDTRYQIISTLSDKLTNGRHQIVVTTDDGRILNGSCSMGLTTVDFTEKTTCLALAADLSADNVAVDIKEKVDGAKSLMNKKIKIDKDGKPIDFIPGLEIGKTYVLTVRAPKTVSRKVEFVAVEGTTNLNDIILSVGDIYPVASPDNKINAFDIGEMSREWSIKADVSRAADLNNDSRVNSVDYACLQNNYNKSGD